MAFAHWSATVQGNVTVALLFGALENNFGVLRSTDGRQSILEKLGDLVFCEPSIKDLFPLTEQGFIPPFVSCQSAGKQRQSGYESIQSFLPRP